MKVTTSITSHDFDLEGARRVLVLAKTLGDTKFTTNQVAVDLSFQDRYLKVHFTGRELDLIRALKQTYPSDGIIEPNLWETFVDMNIVRELDGVSFEPQSVDATLFLIRNLLTVCRSLLKHFKKQGVPTGYANVSPRVPQTITVRKHTGELIEQFTF